MITLFQKLIPLSTHTPRAEAFTIAYCGVTAAIGARLADIITKIGHCEERSDEAISLKTIPFDNT